VIGASTLEVAAHEAAHGAAAAVLGRRLMYVSRNLTNCGESFSLQKYGADPLDGVVVLLAPIYAAPSSRYLAIRDIGVARALRQDHGVDVSEALSRAETLVTQPDFRRAFRIIEHGLWSRPVLTGDELALMLSLDEETT